MFSLDYLNRADKEMNIIRKQVRESLDERRELLDQVEELMSLLKYRDRYQQGDKVFKTENDRVEELSNAIAAKGYHLEQLYRYKNIGEALLKNIDDYKKHLYVDGQICRRLLNKSNFAHKF